MSGSEKYCGVVVPMVSPFTPAGGIDDAAAARIVEHLIANRIGGIFPLGTTGEAASMYPEDKRKLVAEVVKRAGKRAMVYAGIASNCFRESTEAAAAYEQLGVDAVVAHVPSYFPLSDAEIEAYFLHLADGVRRPLVVYNIPATTHHSIALDTIDRLRTHPNIVAIKDSANDRPRLAELLRRTGGRGGFPVLLGNSTNFAHGLKLGAVGLVPSGGQIVPELYQGIYEAAVANRWDEAERLQQETALECSRFLNSRSVGESLGKLKAIMESRGLCGRTMLTPLRDYVGNVDGTRG